MLTNKQQRMYDFWIDKPVPYCCRECVPREFQHSNQLYHSEQGKTCKRQEEIKKRMFPHLYSKK